MERCNCYQVHPICVLPSQFQLHSCNYMCFKMSEPCTVFMFVYEAIYCCTLYEQTQGSSNCRLWPGRSGLSLLQAVCTHFINSNMATHTHTYITHNVSSVVEVCTPTFLYNMRAQVHDRERSHRNALFTVQFRQILFCFMSTQSLEGRASFWLFTYSLEWLFICGFEGKPTSEIWASACL